MYTKTIKTALIKKGLAVSVLLLGSGAAFGQTASLATSGTGAVDVGASPIPVTEVITLTAATGTPFDANSVSTSIVAPFSQDLSACNNGSLITSCTINVTATPTAPGPVSQPVTITATTGGGVNIVTLTSVVTLTATGILPTVNPSGPSLTFTDPGPGNTATQTVTLSNIADTAVVFTWTLNATGSYALDPSSTCTTSPISLSGAAGKCTIVVDFKSPPTGVDPGTASLTVTQTGSSANPALASIAFGEQNPGAVAVGAGGTVEVELTAAPTSITLPDGTTAPMWGYRCMNSAACSALNPNAGGNWSPVVITALAGQTLAIDLTNSLSFANGTTSPTLVPTSLVIVGQLGGGLGSPTTAGSPVHSSQVVTWSTVGSNPVFTPPPQGNRVQSFATEVAVGATTRLLWTNLRPGTYLLESGTHPSIQVPMGLIGMVVVTNPPTAGTPGTPGTAYPGVTYNSELPLLMSEIDPVQNSAVQAAVSTAGFSETASFNLRNNVASVTATAGGSCYAVGNQIVFSGGGGTGAMASVTSVNATATASCATDGTGAITAITVSAGGSGYTGAPGAVVSPTAGSGAVLVVGLALTPNTLASCVGGTACYPPAVNYTPLYYAFNGVPFNKTNASASLFQASAVTGVATGATGNVLVRLANAGLRMHVPSIVGSLTLPTGATTAPTAPVTGFSLVAEDGNPVPGVQKVQHEVFMAAGKTYDVMINVPSGSNALPIYARDLALSGNAVNRDAGMLAYIGVNGAALPSVGSLAPASCTSTSITINSLIPATPGPYQLQVSDPSKGIIGLAQCTNVQGVQPAGPVTGLTLGANGTFAYTGPPTTFNVCANGSGTGGTCTSGITLTVTLSASTIADSGVTCSAPLPITATISGYIAAKAPGVLAKCTDGAHLPLTVTAATTSSGTIYFDANGGFTISGAASGSVTASFTVADTLGKTAAGTATITFPAGSGLNVTVLDGYTKQPLTGGAFGTGDYRWLIEEDQTFYINPNCTQNPPPAGCPSASTGIVPTFGVNFHTSHMPFVAQGCTGPQSCEGGQTVLGVASVCDVGNGSCRPDTTGNGFTPVSPSQVALDPTKHYYITVFPGDAANPFYGASAQGHGMGGAPIQCAPPPAPACTSLPAVTVLTQPSPYPPGKLSVFVFEDDFPLNGEQDGGGGVDVLSPNEPGLGGFQIHLWDAMGGDGDFTGQMGFDMFNQPLTNSLAGLKDPSTGLDACPIVVNPLQATTGANPTTLSTDPTATGKTGFIVTCPKFESDGKTLSPLAGFAVVDNLMPGRWGAIATPGADRIARGEEWLQTNTLDGQKAHDVFTRIGEPSFFQEFSPAGPHVKIGFANPAIINARLKFVCNGTDANLQLNTGATCTNALSGTITSQRLSRAPDERLYSSGSHDAFAWTQCFVSVGDPDGEDFAFTKCDANGNFKFTGLPDGDWRITSFDQWNDQLVDGLSTPVRLGSATNLCPGTGSTQHNCIMGDIAATQWETNIQTRTCIDDNKDGICASDETGAGLLLNVAVRKRDGTLENLLTTDGNGVANFNETFPLFSWYTVETDITRYKNTGTHVVYDVGGPADGSTFRDVHGNTVTCTPAGAGGYPPCGSSIIASHLANTAEIISVPTNLRVPGSVYCKDADCSTHTGGGANGIQWAAGTTHGPNPSDSPSNCSTSTISPFPTTCSTNLSSGRIDNPWYGAVEGWQGFPGQFSFIEFAKAPYSAGENGGIHGHVVYASTRPFDDPNMLVQTQWTPSVPDVTVNLYREDFAADGVTPTLTLVDHTVTSSWDKWAQGFHLAADSVTMIPNMNCPGQGASTGPIPDLFFFSLYNQPQYLDWYNNVQHGTAGSATALPNNSQFKCYDGMHNWNQLQPAPYDGMYRFPSITGYDPTTGKPSKTNCTICTPDPVPAPDLYAGVPMLPIGKYVVEVVVPAGYELVKEEDKNILIGDNFIAPVTQQFGGLGNVVILPDQASVAAATTGPWAGSGQWAGAGYNANNAQNPTQSFGAIPENGIVPSFVPEPIWPCVGESRIVPDFISLFPQSGQVSPFAGATRNLCDRKEVTLSDQMGASAKFWLYTSTHIASKFTGGITNDLTSEFDPFSSQFGEKFAPPDIPVSIKDWTGNEISRVYADHWGNYNGMTYSSWEVNPPNPTGFSPTMMVMCMNDQGPIPGPGGTMIQDPLFNSGYSQFCYELPFMPGNTTYLDTPVVPTSGFAGAGYNDVDCSYPDATPAIAEVDSSNGVGPWVAAAGTGNTLTITALGDQQVRNYGYGGPSFNSAPWNQKTINRHYGFGTQSTGTQCTTGQSCVALVGSDGVPHPLTGVTWTDTTITGTVPTGVPNCPMQQQAQYGGSTAQCGQLVVTAANGKQSIDTVTVTIGGKQPTHVAASASVQAAIDFAAPGDMLMIDPTCNTATTQGVACNTTGVNSKSTAAHLELLVMWKPVRLQGVGAASSILNGSPHPAGKLDPWRRQVNCLFGLSINGFPMGGSNPFDSSGIYQCTAGTGPTFTTTGPNGNTWNYYNPTGFNPQIDRLPLEATVGWDASLNGNLAELLQEPSLMGALEGAGITALGKGVFFASNPYDPTLLGGFPTDTVLFTAGNTGTYCNVAYASNFYCNPSSIDGLGITNSSQGGGGLFLHGWNHDMQIANNRVYGNVATLSGGINIGQGEFPGSYVQGSATNAAPGSCETSAVTGAQLPYCHNVNINVHNNNISLNSSLGDELFAATPAGAGGISICTGSDYYKFNYNWVCGNLSTGDGGGFGHLGYSKNGDIEHNTIIFNQSSNPTIPANGGGMVVMGTPDIDPTCGSTTDLDCVAPGPSDGVGPNLMINANLIMGNSAESGSGGGVAFQNVNGNDVISFPLLPNPGPASPGWHHVVFQNNIVADNVAGWDGAGISLLDALNTDIVNNTIVSNSTTASAGPLTQTIGAPLASTTNTANANCHNGAATASCPQPAGLVSLQTSAGLNSGLPGTITCPTNHYAGTVANNGTCRSISYPLLTSNIFWQNSAYYIGVGAFSTQFQQNVVTLYNSVTNTPVPSQPTADATAANGAGVTITGGTGACITGAGAPSFWDIGVRGDTGPNNHAVPSLTLNPTQSVITDITSYSSGPVHNTAGHPNFASQYCNGSRVPPEACNGVAGGCGWQVPPGIADATVPNPVFNLTPVATVDEGNNWINMRWGPLSLVNPFNNTLLANYALTTGSPDIDWVPSTTSHPAADFFGNARPETGGDTHFDPGAIEFNSGAAVCTVSVEPTALAFGNEPVTSGAALLNDAMTLTVSNSGARCSGGTFNITPTTAPFVRANGAAGGTCGGTLNAEASCTYNVVFSPKSAAIFNGTLTIAFSNGTVSGSPVSLSGTGVAVGTGHLSFTSATNGTVAGGTLTFAIPTPRAPVTSVVTLTNTGTGPLYVTDELLSSGTSGLFSITGTTCVNATPLPVGGTCTVGITYATPATQPGSANTGAMAVLNNGTGTSVGASTLSLSAR